MCRKTGCLCSCKCLLTIEHFPPCIRMECQLFSSQSCSVKWHRKFPPLVLHLQCMTSAASGSIYDGSESHSLVSPRGAWPAVTWQGRPDLRARNGGMASGRNKQIELQPALTLDMSTFLGGEILDLNPLKNPEQLILICWILRGIEFKYFLSLKQWPISPPSYPHLWERREDTEVSNY